MVTPPNCTFINRLIILIVRLLALVIPRAENVGAKPPVAIVKFYFPNLLINFSDCFLYLIM